MADGAQGLQGVLGTQGPQGHSGNQGNQGNQGNRGIQGTEGIPGIQGGVGLQGERGNQGNQGIQGFRGDRGYDGPMGASVSQGNQGNQGNQGSQGYQGVIHRSGRQGPSVGNQGTQGAQGIIGQSTTYFVSASNNALESTAFENVAGLSNITYSIGSYYIIDGSFNLSEAGGGVRMNYSGGEMDGIDGFVYGPGDILSNQYSHFNGTPMDILGEGDGAGTVFFTLTVRNIQDTTTGKFTLAKISASGGDSLLLPGSWVKVTKMH